MRKRYRYGLDSRQAFIPALVYSVLLILFAGMLASGCSPRTTKKERPIPPVSNADIVPVPSAPVKPKTPGLEIARDGQSRYSIVIAENASPAVRYAAAELQAFLREMTGAELAIVTDRQPLRRREIILGNNAHLKKLDLEVDFSKLGKEGYVIRTAGTRLIIAGGEPRGTLYGVYGLLDDHLGCRWFTPKVSRIPHHDPLILAPLDETRVPALEYRETYLWESYDGDWAARNRLDRNSKDGGLTARHGGRWEFAPGYFAHTFAKFVPPEKYFAIHPEYFSMVNGKRLKEQSQLCCTNPEVVRLVTEGVLQVFRDHPEADIVSVSQNDWYNSCECPRCVALSDIEGTRMAPVLSLVNRVAEEVQRNFPGKSVETLAYQWTRKAPKTMRPRPNVVIRLCTIECCFSHSLRSCDSPRNQAFARDLREWAKVADRLWIWNYNTSFAHYFIPYPDLRSRADNVRFFVENHVRGIFQQDIYSTGQGELSELSGYLNARLLWDPQYDPDTAMNEFLDGVYGPAAKPIREYIDLLHDRVEKENIHIGIWQGPDAEYLTDGILARADSLWDAAEKATEDQPEVLARVKAARLSEDYAVICRDRLRGEALTVNQDSCRLEVNPAFTTRLDRFCTVANGAEVRRIREYDTTVDEFRSQVEKEIQPRALRLVSSATSETGEPGLVFKRYDGSWKKMPAFASLIPAATGAMEWFTLPSGGNGSTFGYVVSGYISVPQDGVYTFWTRSDGYSALSISGEEIIRNGGMDPIRERCGYLALKAGLHPVELTYFTREGCTRLTVSWRGPDFEKQEIPAECFRTIRTAMQSGAAQPDFVKTSSKQVKNKGKTENRRAARRQAGSRND